MFCQAPNLGMFTCTAVLTSPQYSVCVKRLFLSSGSCLALHSYHPGPFTFFWGVGGCEVVVWLLNCFAFWHLRLTGFCLLFNS